MVFADTDTTVPTLTLTTADATPASNTATTTNTAPVATSTDALAPHPPVESETLLAASLPAADTTDVVVATRTEPSVFTVPFYSQLTDITAASWKKVGCGITSLAMLIAFYEPGELDSVDSLLAEGIAAGAYSPEGWTYRGLIDVAAQHGLGGSTHDYRTASMETAFTEMVSDLARGPVMASVHYTFTPTNPIPHLVIINGIKNGTVYYNDPADTKGGGSISVAQFKSSWKKRYLEFYKTT